MRISFPVQIKFMKEKYYLILTDPLNISKYPLSPLFFETRSYVDQAGLKFTVTEDDLQFLILLSLSPECWDHRWVACLASAGWGSVLGLCVDQVSMLPAELLQGLYKDWDKKYEKQFTSGEVGTDSRNIGNASALLTCCEVGAAAATRHLLWLWGLEDEASFLLWCLAQPLPHKSCDSPEWRSRQRAGEQAPLQPCRSSTNCLTFLGSDL